MKPIDFRLVSRARATAGYLILVVALAVLATSATVAIAWALSNFVVGLFVVGESLEELSHFLWIGLASGAIRAAVHFAQEFAGFWAAGRVKLQLRAQALDVIERDGNSMVAKYGSGELSQLLGPSLDSLDVYFSKYLPQLVFTALVTPALTLFIWLLDPISGLTVLFTLPLIPLFMVMIGLATRDLQASQLEALEKLNGHFLEILKGIVTLKVFGRTQLQSAILSEVSEQYRTRTMKVLRLSFLSGFALELAASLSVALIAVSIGLRLVAGELPLLIGLFVLVIAPEVYLPLRNVGAQFHAASQGVAVSTRVLDLIQDKAGSPGSTLKLDPKPGLTVVVGKSGAGKSLALKALISPKSTWMSQDSQLVAGTVLANVCGPVGSNRQQAEQALEKAQLSEVSIETVVSERDGLSGGQRQRVALARAFYHLEANNNELLLLDEPTSQLDEETERQVINQIRRYLEVGVRVVAVSHSPRLIAAADQVVELGK